MKEKKGERVWIIPHPLIPQEKLGFEDHILICKDPAKDALANLSKCSAVLLQSIESCLDCDRMHNPVLNF